ncbi:MAG TPA: uroporphyrinogen decarboxylase, partial [Planctomycetaceae bacterium]|nr:uroporphyrinogen decarboxylase [Planctomycetaceae bacterium]
PSAWGSRCIWPENEFPHAARVVYDYQEVERLKKPDCRTDGLCPFVIKRLEHCQQEMATCGHPVRFATSRGPHNIASYLLGHTEFLIGFRTHPQQIQHVLEVVTDFVVDWLRYQAAQFPTIDGLLVLDDLIGFVGEADFKRFVLPHFERIGRALDVSVKALHNDAHGLITARYLRQMGFNLFNFSYEHSLAEIRRLAGDGVVLLGNIPPRDVLAKGTPEHVAAAVRQSLASIDDHRWLIVSGGGGTPPGVPSENITALLEAAAAPH